MVFPAQSSAGGFEGVLKSGFEKKLHTDESGGGRKEGKREKERSNFSSCGKTAPQFSEEMLFPSGMSVQGCGGTGGPDPVSAKKPRDLGAGQSCRLPQFPL